jgi:hypothetical protein
MSNYDYEDEDDNNNVDTSTDLIKQLRKANKQKEKELADLKAQFEGLNKSQRERAIKDALAARGVNTKIASFIPQDIDPTEESVSKWLESNADVFGIQSSENQTPSVDPTQAKQYQRMTNAAEQGNSPSAAENIMQKLLSANSREELDAVIRQSGL